MSELTGGLTNYYLVQVDHPQRKGQAPYQAECEDISEALQLTPNEFCEFKAIWRTAAARLGNGKPGQKALYDAQKRVHYATRDLRRLERELVVAETVVPEEDLEDSDLIHCVSLSNKYIYLINGIKEQLPHGLYPATQIQVQCKHHKWDEWSLPGPAGMLLDPSLKGPMSEVTRFRLHPFVGKARSEIGPVPGTVEEDGWIIHGGDEMPEPLNPEQLVDVRLTDGVEYTGTFAKPAKLWVWIDDGTHSRITHYRLAKVEQKAPPAGEWKDHTWGYMPEGLDPDEMIEVKLNTGHELIMAKRADAWDWAIPDTGQHPDRPFIAAWRRYRHNAV